MPLDTPILAFLDGTSYSEYGAYLQSEMEVEVASDLTIIEWDWETFPFELRQVKKTKLMRVIEQLRCRLPGPPAGGHSSGPPDS